MEQNQYFISYLTKSIKYPYNIKEIWVQLGSAEIKSVSRLLVYLKHELDDVSLLAANNLVN